MSDVGKKYSIGLIKWFGGYNNRTGRENHFGFIEDSSGVDVFIHEKQLTGRSDLDEQDLMIYEVKEGKGKLSAHNASVLSEFSDDFKTIYDVAKELYNQHKLENKNLFSRKIQDVLYDKFLDIDINSLSSLREGLREDFFILKIINDRHGWEKNFYELIGGDNLPDWVLSDLPWHYIPPTVISDNETVFAKYISSLSIDDAKKISLNYQHIMTPALLFYLIVVGVYKTDDDLSVRYDDVYSFVKAVFSGSTSFPKYLSDAFQLNSENQSGYRSNPVLVKMIDACLFKKYLYEKNPKFIKLYFASPFLRSRFDFFVLYGLFELIWASNSLDTVYSVFVNRLWNGILNNNIDVSRQKDEVLELFPTCGTFSSELSCEAVYWVKTDSYLCRGTKCRHPQIRHDLSKNYVDFNIYDWFKHYDIDYLNHEKPSNKDFPIKLAAYINRIREIFEIIKCRCCGKLMQPDMRYARTEYTAFENNEAVVKDMAAAYRLTVFRCAEETCTEYNKGYYINHCVGFGCYSVIDTRDLKIQCDNGRYVCKGCGSCCEEHAKSNPIGICPQCGGRLKLFEKSSNGYTQRFVKCGSGDCDFEIGSGKLPKKFTLDGCQPVIKLNSSSSGLRFYRRSQGAKA